jgi:hypothetical protein
MKRIIRLICLSGWLMLSFIAPAQAITIDLIPNDTEVTVGTPLTVGIAISDLAGGTAPSLGSFDINLMYDTTLLSFAGPGNVSFGDQLDLFGLGSIQAVDDSTAGIVNLFELSLDLADDLDNLQLPDFTLATLTFGTLTEGISTLALSVNTLADSNGGSLTAEVIGTDINITSSTEVPEPYQLLLLFSGIASLYWLRRTTHGRSHQQQ